MPTGVLFIACLLALAWQPQGRLWRSLWAEDGTRFTICAARSHFGSCLTAPYGGYLHAAPRLLAQVAVATPVQDWALATCLLALTVDAAALALIYHTTGWLLPAPARAAAVLTVALSAATHAEAAGNLANLHWFLLVSSVFIAADRDMPDGVWPLTWRGAWLAVSCLSEAIAPAIVAAYAVGLIARRRRRGSWNPGDLAVGAAVLAAAGGQMVVHFTNPRPPNSGAGAETLKSVEPDYWQWVVRSGWHGHGSALATVVLFAGGVLLAAAVVTGAVRRCASGPQLTAGVVLVASGFVIFAASVIVNHAVSPRYMTAPFTLTLIGALTAGRALLDGIRWANHAISATSVAAAVALLIAGPVSSRVADSSAAWRHDLKKASRQCRAPGATAVHVPIAPGGAWTTIIDCDRL